MKNSLHSEIFWLTCPSIVSNITVPLLSMVDTTIVGHMGSPSYIGAIAIGSTLFNMVYWIFGFLRMGTTGLVSQAHGAENRPLKLLVLRKSLLYGCCISAILLLLQIPFLRWAFLLMKPEATIASYASQYFHVCIWGAPAMLSQYCLTGWMIGVQDTRSPMWIAISQNLINIVASLFFVFYCRLRIEGVALGTVVAQWSGCLMALMVLLKKYRVSIKDLTTIPTSIALPHRQFFSVNGNLFLRTLCMVAVTLYFTSAGSQMGNEILSANSLIMQFFILYSYFVDGLANAAEALSGRYVGAEDWRMLRHTVSALFSWGLAISVAFSLLYAVSGDLMLRLFTNQESIILTARSYLPWAYAIPLVALMAMVWDGIFIGTTQTRGMLVATATAMLVFFAVWFLLKHSLLNHALWLAFVCYLLTRGIVQTIVFNHYKQ